MNPSTRLMEEVVMRALERSPENIISHTGQIDNLYLPPVYRISLRQALHQWMLWMEAEDRSMN